MAQQTTKEYRRKQPSTLDAIKQCGAWAHQAGVIRDGNPFSALTTSYNIAWDEGWLSYIPDAPDFDRDTRS